MVKPILTEAERTVMKIIWDAGEDVVMGSVLEKANTVYNRDWKPQTVTAYLSHLMTKGFIEMYRDGKKYYYKVLIDEATYRKEYVQKEIQFWSKGNRMAFIKDTLDALSLTNEEIEIVKAGGVG